MLRYAKVGGLTYRLESDYEIKEQTGASAVSSMSLALGGQAIPEPFDIIEVYDESDVLQFSGVCGIPETITSSTGYEPDNVTLQVQSLNTVLARRTVNEAWQSSTISAIVADIFDGYIAVEGFTLGTISTISTAFDVYTAARLTVATVLDELAAKSGAIWNIDNKTGAFSFVVRGEVITVPAKARISSVKRSESSRDLRSRQIIMGAMDKTSSMVATMTWVAGQASFNTPYVLHHGVSATVAGSPAGVGVAGIDDNDTSKTFLYSFKSDLVRVNPLATLKPATGNTVTFTYIGLFEVEVQADNDPLIAAIKARTGTSGVIESVDSDSSIVTVADGDTSARALLQKYGESNVTVTLDCDDPSDTDLMTAWTFALPALHIEGDFVVTSRSRRRLTDDKERFRLTLSDRDFFLKYGATYGMMANNITRLSIRNSVVVVQSQVNNELIRVGETFDAYTGDVFQFPGVEPGPYLDVGGFYPVEA